VDRKGGARPGGEDGHGGFGRRQADMEDVCGAMHINKGKVVECIDRGGFCGNVDMVLYRPGERLLGYLWTGREVACPARRAKSSMFFGPPTLN
jgi:hypothetical protein